METTHALRALPSAAWNAYPRPWDFVDDPGCPRLVDAQGATLLAGDRDEAPLLQLIALVVNYDEARTFRAELAHQGLSQVLTQLMAYESTDVFVEALILAAEGAIQALAPREGALGTHVVLPPKAAADAA
ncbi:MAG: hypothetical protein EOM24_23015 [Chloroflexia bacterium]|nr:hypothetical protein [Chloroflexia bacterium]